MASNKVSQHPSAIAGRHAKALAMTCVIDANAIRQGISPYDQAARILLASFEWPDAVWEQIGASALMPNGKHYERKAISPETREALRSIYRGRAQAPVSRARAS